MFITHYSNLYLKWCCEVGITARARRFEVNDYTSWKLNWSIWCHPDDWKMKTMGEAGNFICGLAHLSDLYSPCVSLIVNRKQCFLSWALCHLAEETKVASWSRASFKHLVRRPNLQNSRMKFIVYWLLNDEILVNTFFDQFHSVIPLSRRLSRASKLKIPRVPQLTYGRSKIDKGLKLYLMVPHMWHPDSSRVLL